jgi:hypothetical protein
VSEGDAQRLFETVPGLQLPEDTGYFSIVDVFDVLGRDGDDLVQKLVTKIRAPRIAPRPALEKRIDLPCLAGLYRPTHCVGRGSAGDSAGGMQRGLGGHGTLADGERIVDSIVVHLVHFVNLVYSGLGARFDFCRFSR